MSHPTIAQTTRGPMEYRLQGQGPVVVVLYGGHASRTTRLSHERLAEHGFTVLVPSRPGYDRTPVETGRTAEAAADAIVALLDTLRIATASLIGVSAAGPTALALAQSHPDRIRKLVLEAALATEWDAADKRRSRFLFGRLGSLTWGLLHLALRVAPDRVVGLMMRELSVLDPPAVLAGMDQADRTFVAEMVGSLRAGRGFLVDVEHRIVDLSQITVPTLVLYSPHDRPVPPRNAERLGREVPNCELYPVPAASHLLWIGPHAEAVWQKRLAFLSG